MAIFEILSKPNIAPSTQLRWGDTNTMEARNGNLNSEYVCRTPVYDADGDNILSTIWQINTGTGWIDYDNSTTACKSLPAIKGLNQYRVKIEDVYNNIGYSNILEYTKAPVAEKVSEVCSIDMPCGSFWIVSINVPEGRIWEVQISINNPQYADGTGYVPDCNASYNYTNVPGTFTLTSPGNYGFGINGGNTDGAGPLTTVITMNIIEDGTIIETRGYSRNHTNNLC